jgi:hypothetical protein
MKFLKLLVIFAGIPSAALAALSNAERKSQFEKAMASIIAANHPSMSVQVRERLVKEYTACKSHKGQAVELSNGSYFRSCEHEDSPDVGDRSLEACQLRYGKPCALLAVNEEIVAEGDLKPKDMPRMHYAGKYDPSQIPIIRSITRKRTDVQVYDKAMEPKAMAIHPWGKVFISAGDPTLKDAQASALNKCNGDSARNGRDGPCMVYAVNNDVVIGERRMLPK